MVAAASSEGTRMLLHLLKPLVAMLAALSGPISSGLPGSSPQLSFDTRGTVRIIFGHQDTILAITSTDQGRTFGKPLVVGIVPDMHLGNTRGPVIASSRTRSLVAAVDNAGNIHLFQLDHAAGTWQPLPGTLNDKPGSAPEGLMTLAADDAGDFFATWLDVRVQHHNQVFFSRSSSIAGNLSWTPNAQVNTSPLGSACECCRPGIAVANGTVAIMFRNNLNGARDMYLATSMDHGRTFSAARLLGRGTWKLDACPMDGGAVHVAASGQITTLWRRESTLYTARPDEAEVAIGTGRSPMMSIGPSAAFVIWQDGEQIRLTDMNGRNPVVIADGRLPQVLALPDGRALTAWEKSGAVFYRRID